MSEEIQITITPRAQAALDELQAMIAARFPQANFVVQTGLDPAGIYLVATVDVEDTEEVFEVVVDRLLEIQVHEGLPVDVTPLRPIERVMAQLREEQAQSLPPLPATG